MVDRHSHEQSPPPQLASHDCEICCQVLAVTIQKEYIFKKFTFEEMWYLIILIEQKLCDNNLPNILLDYK